MNALINAASDKMKNGLWVVEISSKCITYSARSEPEAEPTCVFVSTKSKHGVHVTYPRYELDDDLVSFAEAERIIIEMNGLDNNSIISLVEFMIDQGAADCE